MTAQEHQQLIKRAQNGDENAFSQVFDLYYDTIYRFAFRWTGNSNDAQDVTQLACIKLAQSLKQFRFESAFSSWLYRLVINTAKDWQKSEGRHTGATEAPLDEPSLGGNQEHHAYLFQVIKLLEGMGKDMKETALLTLTEGVSQKEAAEILQVKESTIAWRVHEIRQQLRLLTEREVRK